jgi:TonB-dependent receptor
MCDMMKKKFVLVVASVFATILSFAQVDVKGTLFQMEEGQKEPIPFATVMLIGSEGIGTTTDFDGNFTIKLNEGKHQLKISSVGLLSQIIDIDAAPGMELVTLEMSKEANMLSGVTVVHKVQGQATDAQINKDIKDSEGVVSKKNKKTIEEQGGSNVEDAVKSMAGISSGTSNSMVYIRGLGDRYNMAYLNGLPMPSPNSELRMIDLSMFPTSILDAVGVNKVLDASYYGDYAGGMINIETSKFFSKPTLNISIGTGMNTATTFKDFRTYNGGKLDYLGIDNDARQIPTNVVSQAAENQSQYLPDGFYNSSEGYGDGFENNFNTSLKKAMPNLNYKIEGGNFWSFVKKTNGKRKKPFSKGIGFMALLKHGTDYSFQTGTTKIVNAQSEDRLNYDFDKYTFNTSTTGMVNFHYQIAEKHNISYNFLYINTSSDETKETWGTHFDYEDGGDVYARRLTFKQNNIYLNQLKGEHKFLKNDRYNLTWALSYGITNSQEPDRRQLVYQYAAGEKENTSAYTMFSQDANQNHRFFSKLKEKELAARLDNDVVLVYRKTLEKDANGKVLDATKTSLLNLKYGFSYKSKDRDFGFRQFNYDLKLGLAEQSEGIANAYDPDFYITDANHDGGLYNVKEVSNPSNWYEASLDIYAGYMSLNYKPLANLEIIPAVRLEYGEQVIRNRNQTQFKKLDVNTIAGLEYMPSLAFKYTLKDNHVFRLVGSKTITRPKFSEVAPFQYVADFAGITAQGNPELVNGTNYNGDFRYEWYPTKTDIISVGAFYKYLQTPIEKTMIATASGQLQSFSNAKSATVAGVEIEVSKNLGFFSKNKKSVWNDFAIAFNAAYMFTQVKIDQTTSSINTNNDRPLEGASPFLANASLKYEKRFGGDNGKKHKIMAAVSYNVFGRRLFAVGSNGIGDQYEAPVHLMNFILKTDIGRKVSLGLNVGNLLNATYNVEQQDRVNEGEWLEINSYKRGVDVSLSVSYKILEKSAKKKEPKDL